MNRRIQFLLASLLMVFIGYAQEDEYETLFKNNVSISGFGGVMMSWASVSDQTVYELGGGGGILINNTIFIGGFGTGSTIGIRYRYSNLLGETIEDRFRYGFGGIWLGQVFLPKKLIHPYIDLRLGWGEAGFRTTNSFEPYSYYESTNIFVIDPRIGVEVNLARWMRIQGQAGYRVVQGLDLYSEIDGGRLIQSDDMDGLTLGLSIIFGWF